MGKIKYHEHLDDISSDELLEGLVAYGLFADKIPRFLSAVDFFQFCKNQEPAFFEKKDKGVIQFESMRNVNVPRILSIPNPIAHWNLCYVLSESWNEIKEHFATKTQHQNHKISRIHIRKIEDEEAIFEMEYDFENELLLGEIAKPLFRMSHKDPFKDDYPEPELLIGARYLVEADIANCFPSIYTHSIPWALVGRGVSKANRDEREWFNKIDKFLRNTKNGETNGILIGPHTSNLISEVILVTVDESLFQKGYKFIRHIDDYTCFVDSYEKALRFTIDLAEELKKYNLLLNHKKTEIKKLPIAMTSQWVRRLNSFDLTADYMDFVGLDKVRRFLDAAIDLTCANNNNAAIINYATKVLSNKKLTPNAKTYFVNTIHHLVLLYPYLARLLEEHVFNSCNVAKDVIRRFSNNLLTLGIESNLNESIAYAIYFSLVYDFPLENEVHEIAINSRDCIVLLLGYLYETKHNKSKSNLKEYKKLAEELSDENTFDEFWLFTYEVLSQSRLKSYWKKLKQSNVSFLKNEFSLILQ